MSARTTDDAFAYLNGVQGQFVDRTTETQLRREREELLGQRLRDQEVIEEKNQQLESLADRLAKYPSPQIYQSIFSDRHSGDNSYHRHNLTVMFSDIERFTELTDMLEPERLARVINSYLSEMTSIAIDCGGTIDNFGSKQRLDYTALGGPVNLAARRRGISPTKEILIDEYTWGLIQDRVECAYFDEFQPKGFRSARSRPTRSRSSYPRNTGTSATGTRIAATMSRSTSSTAPTCGKRSRNFGGSKRISSVRLMDASRRNRRAKSTLVIIPPYPYRFNDKRPPLPAPITMPEFGRMSRHVLQPAMNQSDRTSAAAPPR